MAHAFTPAAPPILRNSTLDAAAVLAALVLVAGCTLIDQTTFDPNAGKKPVPVAPVAPVVARPPPGPPAFMTISFPRTGDLRAEVAEAVKQARARKPDVAFDVVEVVGSQPGEVGEEAAEVARLIVAQGVPAGRVHLQAQPETGAVGRQVRVYVR